MGKKFDVMAVATQVGAATVAGAGAGLAVDKFLPQMDEGYKGFAMAALAAVATGAGVQMKQPMMVSAGAGIAGAAGDRLQKRYLGGGGGAANTPAAGVGDIEYTVVEDSEVRDYPTNGIEDGGGVAGTDDNGGVA